MRRLRRKRRDRRSSGPDPDQSLPLFREVEDGWVCLKREAYGRRDDHKGGGESLNAEAPGRGTESTPAPASPGSSPFPSCITKIISASHICLFSVTPSVPFACLRQDEQPLRRSVVLRIAGHPLVSCNNAPPFVSYSSASLPCRLQAGVTPWRDVVARLGTRHEPSIRGASRCVRPRQLSSD